MYDKSFLLQFSRAPGDVLMLTSLVRDLKLTYGRRYRVGVEAPFPHLWENNPHVDRLEGKASQTINFSPRDKKQSSADRAALLASQRGSSRHYATAFHTAFTTATGIPVEPLFSKADLHLTDAEKSQPRISGRYWIIIPGGKTDMTNKWWSHQRYQEVVDCLLPWGLSFVQEGTTKRFHVHRPLNNVLNMIGKTTIRELIVNIYHAEGVICGCSLPMHIAGALDKPCVVILGGREEPAFEAYVNDYGGFGRKAEPVKVPHRVLHTVGLLDCCKTRGCWKRRVVKLSTGKPWYNASLCKMPDYSDPTQPLPKCMEMITTDHVIESIMSYYEQGFLEPLPGWYRQ